MAIEVDGNCQSHTGAETTSKCDAEMISQFQPRGECNDLLSIYNSVKGFFKHRFLLFVFFRLKTHCKVTSFCFPSNLPERWDNNCNAK